MSRNPISRNLFFGLSMAATVAFSGFAQAADPSMHQVYQAAEAGNYAAAQGMMDQVLKDHPNSGKAHFVEAELLAKQGKLSAAQSELATAERLEPGLPFAKPGSVQELKSLLAAPHAAATGVAYAAAPAAPSFPWGMLIIGLVLLAAIIFFIRSRQQAATYIPAGVNPGYGGGATYGTPGFGPNAPMSPNGGQYNPGYGAAPMAGGGIGSGIMGGLATGAAVGVGMVAGEALMHRMMDGGGNHSNVVQNDGFVPIDNGTSQYDMGGNDFGVSDSSSWDDSSSDSGGGDW